MGNDDRNRGPVKTPAAKAAVNPPPAAASGKKAPNPNVASIVAGKGVVVPKTSMSELFTDHLLAIDTVPNEQKESQARARLRNFVFMESLIIVGLAVFLVLGQPLFQPIYIYYSLSPQKRVVQLAPLTAPNLTNHAILSWAASSITELMTFGFGDFETALIKQKERFTSDGWSAFVTAFMNNKTGETFQHNQLVLTTVPRDTPVIISQGENDKHVYQWVVQMPIIMTYATNNSVTRRDKTIVTLTIVRTGENKGGIAIEKWDVGN